MFLLLLAAFSFTDDLPEAAAPPVWNSDYATAYAAARSQDRPLFIVFCPGSSNYGLMTAQANFVSDRVERQLQTDYVRLVIDTETVNGKAVAKQFEVTTTTYFVILERSVRWQVFFRSGSISEDELARSLVRFRRAKISEAGKPEREVEPVHVAATQTATVNTAASSRVTKSNAPVARVIEIDETDFEREVIERSRGTTVVVDFWAEWCQPCRQLGPVLERQVAERAGEIVLVKINIEKAPNLVQRYRVDTIPSVKAFRDGKPVLEFVGNMGESQLRATLDRLRPVTEEIASRTGESETPAVQR